MLKSVFTIVVFAAVTTAVFAQNLVLSGDVKNCKITSYDKKYFIKLQNNNDIGRVEYNETLKKYVSFAFLPFHIPYSFRRTAREFLSELTKNTKLPGRYYINMSNGEVGYYELADTPVWQPRDVYKLWPEMFRLVGTNARVSTMLKTIRLFPLEERTQGDLSKMTDFTESHIDPGEFEYDDFYVTKDLQIKEPPSKKCIFTIDRKKFAADFEKLRSDTKFEYHAELKKAVEKQDMETIFQIATKFRFDANEYMLCLYYAASHGHAGANFELAKNIFYHRDPQIEAFMPYLQKAADAGFAEAEHFLGQYLYRFDLGTPEEIFNLFKRAYTHGNANAEASLARCYWFGFGTKIDKKKAFEIAKSYLRKTKDPGWSDCFFSIAQTIAGLGYLRFDKNKEKGLKLISATTTVLGVIVVESVYFYGLYGIPQSYGDHDFEGGLEPHCSHLDIMYEGFRSGRDEKIIAIFEYQ